jgi:hypothetical protein
MNILIGDENIMIYLTENQKTCDDFNFPKDFLAFWLEIGKAPCIIICEPDSFGTGKSLNLWIK